MESTKKFAVLRIVFGIVVAIDAFFKWQPGFLMNFATYLTSDGQPALIQRWIHLWINIVGVDPHFFAVCVALAETALAIGLILGLFTRQICYGGIILFFIIWSTAEGFGGPYASGATDIGAAVIYVFMFVALLFGQSGRSWSLDAWRKKRTS